MHVSSAVFDALIRDLPTAMTPSADVEARIDYAWYFKLKQALDNTPLPASVRIAVQDLGAVGIDTELLLYVLDAKAAEWRASGRLYELGVPDEMFDGALSIHAYTLENPSLYRSLNAAMHDPARREGDGGLSATLQAWLPYAKLLQHALEHLPQSFAYHGRCYRGIKWVYPSATDHDPERHFPRGNRLCWYEFKSTSEKQAVMNRDHFCGHTGGPRTIFIVDACRAYSIKALSHYGENEAEVLFPPLTQLEVVSVVRQCNPTPATEEEKGFPDQIVLRQVDATASPPRTPMSALVAEPTNESRPAGADGGAGTSKGVAIGAVVALFSIVVAAFMARGGTADAPSARASDSWSFIGNGCPRPVRGDLKFVERGHATASTAALELLDAMQYGPAARQPLASCQAACEAHEGCKFIEHNEGACWLFNLDDETGVKLGCPGTADVMASSQKSYRYIRR